MTKREVSIHGTKYSIPGRLDPTEIALESLSKKWSARLEADLNKNVVNTTETAAVTTTETGAVSGYYTIGDFPSPFVTAAPAFKQALATANPKQPPARAERPNIDWASKIKYCDVCTKTHFNLAGNNICPYCGF